MPDAAGRLREPVEGPKTVLVTGANGFVGSALCAALCARGRVSVRAATRRQGPPVGAIARAVVGGDMDDATDWGDALQGVDTVFHLAARVHILRETSANPLDTFRTTNVAGSLTLARQAARAGVRRLVFLSSVGVNGAETHDRPYRADDHPAPVSPYAISKREAEDGLRSIAAETGLDVVVVRAPLVYGLDAKGNFARLVRLVRAGIPLPLGAINNRRSFVGLSNLVDLLVTCLAHPCATNQTLMVSDGEDLSTTDLLRRTAAACGVRSRLLPIPAWIVRKTADLCGKAWLGQQLCGSLRLDLSATRERLGWQPPVSVDSALREAVGAP
jgi:UDP-glucose 4-epimerase